MNTKNKISIAISDEAIGNIKGSINEITGNIPGLITLTPKERQKLAKMGDKTTSFVSKALDYAYQNPDVVPKYLDMKLFANDVEVNKRLFTIISLVQKLAEEIDDTKLMIGSQSYNSALVFYDAVKSAIAAGEIGLKSVYDDLSARFPGRPNKKKLPPEK